MQERVPDQHAFNLVLMSCVKHLQCLVVYQNSPQPWYIGNLEYSLTSGIRDEKGIYGRSTGVGLALSPPGTAVLAVSGPTPA